MNSFFSLLRNRAEARSLLFFNLFFFGGMWASKTIHPLWFQVSNSSLLLFSWSYSAMAVTGSLSFILGYLSDKFGTIYALRIGVFLYAVGLALRFYTHSPLIAIISGLIAGLGASTVLVCIRPWIFSWATPEDLPVAIALRSTSVSLGSTLGTLLAGWLPAILGTVYISYPTILLGAACATFTSTFFISDAHVDAHLSSKNDTEKQETRAFDVLRQNFFLTVGVIFIGILYGFHTSLLVPYLPVILSNLGLTLGIVGTLIALNRLTQVFAGLFISNFLSEKYKYTIFVIAGFALSTVTLVLALHLPLEIIIVTVLLRGVFTAASVISEEIIQMALYPKNLMALYFGLSQTGFLIGDTLGGVVGGWIYTFSGTTVALLVSAVLTLANSLIFPFFASIIEKKNKASE